MWNSLSCYGRKTLREGCVASELLPHSGPKKLFQGDSGTSPSLLQLCITRRYCPFSGEPGGSWEGASDLCCRFGCIVRAGGTYSVDRYLLVAGRKKLAMLFPASLDVMLLSLSPPGLQINPKCPLLQWFVTDRVPSRQLVLMVA